MEERIIKYISDNCPSLENYTDPMGYRHLKVSHWELSQALEMFAKEYVLHFLSEYDEYNEYELRQFVNSFVPSKAFLASVEPEPLRNVPLWLIKEKCGWERWCEVVWGKQWLINGAHENPNETFEATEAQLSKLGII